MFNFIKNTLKNIYTQVTSRISSLFAKPHIDKKTLNELKIILLSADAGVETTKQIITALESKYNAGELTKGTSLKQELHNLLIGTLEKVIETPPLNARVFVLVGINGSGKTTVAAKLAHSYTQKGNKVLLIGADTFRAAACAQLKKWADSLSVSIFCGKEGQDPASVVFSGCEQFKKDNYDIVIIDTAGRLHTKVNLMNELAKIKRIITKQLPQEPIYTLLTIDSMLGQNSLEQAKLFKECTEVSGIVLTKMDSSAKGGIIFAIVNEVGIPIWYITYGENINAIKYFEKKEYVENLLES